MKLGPAIAIVVCIFIGFVDYVLCRASGADLEIAEYCKGECDHCQDKETCILKEKRAAEAAKKNNPK